MFVFPTDLSAFERKYLSQFGEDGVLEKIFATIHVVCGTFLEIGVGPPWNQPLAAGLEGNCVRLRERGWKGTWLDGTRYPPEFQCHQEFVTALNIGDILKKYSIPFDLDCMSIDTDGQEYWIWNALEIRPKVMILEYNGGLGLCDPITMIFDPSHVWDGTCYHGASLSALDKLAKRKGYVLVWANGVNGIFVRKDLVANPESFRMEAIFRRYPPHSVDPLNRPWVAV